jgi:TPR repeat protein
MKLTWHARLILALFCAVTAIAQTAAPPADGLRGPTQAEVDQARKIAAQQMGRKLAIDTQARGTWADPTTGLMWAAKDNGKDVSWNNSVKYCASLRTASYSDWRLASIDELEGIYDRNAFAPGLAGDGKTLRAFTWHVKGNLYLTGDQWSSGQRLDDRGHPSGYASRFDFNEGRSFDGDELWFYTGKRALCVRGPRNPLIVEAANHDPAANTPEKIAETNQTLAIHGNPDAAYELGLAYLQGYGVPQDLTQAEQWFRIVATDPGLESLIDLDATAHLPLGDLFELAQTYRQGSPPQTERAAKVYVSLLKQTGHPEVRRAQMELGNFVLDGKYTAGNDTKGRALNLEWARIIAQELLGGEEYKIAMDYDIPRGEVPKDPAMWLRFCQRVAACNIDLAQHFLAQAIMDGTVPNKSGFDDVAWTRLASDKQTGEISQLKAMESGMTPDQHQAADAEYQSLVQTRVRDGACYPPDDLLRNPTPAALASMPNDDPDVQLRRAFALEKSAQTNDDAYREAMDLYRTVRDHREVDVRFILGRDYMNGTNGIPRNLALARVWLNEAANRGSKPAQALLTAVDSPSSKN